MILSKNHKMMGVALALMIPLLGTAMASPAKASQMNTVTATPTPQNLTTTAPQVTLPISTATVAPTATATVAPTDVSGYSSGDGSKKNPYVIKSASQLQNIQANLSKHFILGADIDMMGVKFKPIGSYSADGKTAFSGSLEGNSFAIRNLRINDEESDYQALFAATDGARIMNFKIESATIFGKNNAAALIGHAKDTQVESVSLGSGLATVQVRGQDNIGGMIGKIDGRTTVRYSKVIVDIEGKKNVGGLAGIVEKNAIVRDSASSGKVLGEESVGGLVGRSYGKIADADAEVETKIIGTKTKKGTTLDVGGLVGTLLNTATIDKSSAIGEVTGGVNAGGLIGRAGYEATNGATPSNLPTITIKQSDAGGAVSGVAFVGGFIGKVDTKVTIRKSNATGAVTGEKDVEVDVPLGLGSSSFIGGFVGSIDQKSTIQDATATGNVIGRQIVGGFAGYIGNDVAIRSSKATGDVLANIQVGGFAGVSAGTLVSASVEKGYILQRGSEVDCGGIVGLLINEGTIRNARINTTVEGNENVGGIAGRIMTYYEDENDKPTKAKIATIDNCSVIGAVLGNTNVGGIAGNVTENAKVVNNSVSIKIMASKAPETGSESVGVVGDHETVTISEGRSFLSGLAGSNR